MGVLSGLVDRDAETFRANREGNRALLRDIRTTLDIALCDRD